MLLMTVTANLIKKKRFCQAETEKYGPAIDFNLVSKKKKKDAANIDN